VTANSSKGFTLLELLVVVAIIGVMADLHTIGLGIQAYVVDTSSYPVGSDIAALVPLLGGEYIQRVPQADGWRNQFIYTGVAGVGYSVGSTGKGGGVSLTLIGTGGATSSIEDDIIFSNGSFVQWPEGAQTH